MAAVAQRLQAGGVPMKEYPQTVANLTAIGSNLYELIKGANLIAYADDGVRLAISRAIAKETPRGFQITKEKSSHKIDVVVALAMAAYAAVQHQAVDDDPRSWCRTSPREATPSGRWAASHRVRVGCADESELPMAKETVGTTERIVADLQAKGEHRRPGVEPADEQSRRRRAVSGGRVDFQ
jgi:hypothetical protein